MEAEVHQQQHLVAEAEARRVDEVSELRQRSEAQLSSLRSQLSQLQVWSPCWCQCVVLSARSSGGSHARAALWTTRTRISHAHKRAHTQLHCESVESVNEIQKHELDSTIYDAHKLNAALQVLWHHVVLHVCARERAALLG